jgi:putative DNA-invertase from lambdoid prophage Rac
MIFTFLAAISEFERSLIRERVISGLERAKENGVKLGRRRVGFDFAEAIELKEQGLGVRAIGKRLGVSRSTIHRALKGVPKTTNSNQA